MEEDGGWRFYLGNTGEPVRNDWYEDGGDWYWFDGAGMMVHDNWKTGGDGKWYYLNTNGAMAWNQWVQWRGGLYWMTQDGSMFEGQMCLETNEEGALIPWEVTRRKGSIGEGPGKAQGVKPGQSGGEWYQNGSGKAKKAGERQERKPENARRGIGKAGIKA